MKEIKTYTEPRWRRLREQVLRRDRYTDQILIRYGKIKNAEMVHHIFPKDEFPEYQYEPWNLISITKATHNLLHDRATDELTEKGVELLKRTAKENGIPIPEKFYETRKRKNPKRDSYIPPDSVL